jgi:hypothetical protein
MTLVLSLHEITEADRARIGGKGFALAVLQSGGARVPVLRRAVFFPKVVIPQHRIWHCSLKPDIMRIWDQSGRRALVSVRTGPALGQWVFQLPWRYL